MSPVTVVPTVRPLTPKERAVARLIAEGHRPLEVARRLDIQLSTLRMHTRNLSKIIPGDLPAWEKIRVWGRGAPRYVLEREHA